MIVLCIVWTTRREKARAEAMQSRASGLGFSYAEQDGAPDSTGDGLPLFERGRRHRAQNVMTRMDRDIEMRLFDYAYTTGSGDDSTTWLQSVVCIRSPLIDLPEFALRPENFFDRIGKAFGYQDINFESHTGFSRAFILRGADEARVGAAEPAEAGCRASFSCSARLSASSSRLKAGLPGAVDREECRLLHRKHLSRPTSKLSGI